LYEVLDDYIPEENKRLAEDKLEKMRKILENNEK